MHSHIDFGYPWLLIYGHLIVAAVGLLLCLLSLARKWPKLLLVALGAITLWAAVAFLVVRYTFDINGRMTMPTQSFLAAVNVFLSIDRVKQHRVPKLFASRPKRA